MSVMTGKVDAIWTPQDNTIASAFSTVISSANQAKIPVYTTVDTMVKEGGLASVAQSQYELGKATARSAVKVLKGKKVKDVPVDVIDDGTPTLNLKVAQDLNITIPDDVLKQSDIAVKADMSSSLLEIGFRVDARCLSLWQRTGSICSRHFWCRQDFLLYHF